MLEVEVREAMPTDAAAITVVADSVIATLRRTYRPTAGAITRKQAIDGELTQLVAVANDDVVGTVQYSLESDGRLHFLSLGVHSNFRRKGVAKQLVTALERIGKIAGANRLSAYTVKETGNLRFFQQLGFRVIWEEVSTFFESNCYDSLTETYVERPIA